MKIVQEAREVVASGIGRSRNFTVEVGAHIMAVLSGLYKNPLDAIVREYLTNMYDAYVALGPYDKSKHPAPSLHLPTTMEPYLEFRDNGIGMSVETVWNIYATYGMSTKNANNNEVGGFGLGSKTAFCYQNGQAWTIESRFDGEKYLFMASLDENNLPTLYHASTSKTDEPNGVTIRIPILRQDIPAVHRAAHRYVPYFPMELTVTGTADTYTKPPALVSGADWSIGKAKDYYGTFTVVMGNVPYELEDLLRDNILEGMPFLKNGSGKNVEVVTPIGSVDLVPSRDSLKNTPRTRAQLLALGKHISSEFAVTMKSKMDSFTTMWEKAVWVTSMVDAGFLVDKDMTEGYSVPVKYPMDVHISEKESGNYSKQESASTAKVPVKNVWVMRNDNVQNIDRVARWFLSEKCWHKTNKGRKSKYGHKPGTLFIVNTKAPDGQISESLGGIPLEHFVGKASQFVEVARKVRDKGVENIYKLYGGRTWGARVRIPNTTTVHYVILKKDGVSVRWTYNDIDALCTVAQKVGLGDHINDLYGIRAEEADDFVNRPGWVNFEKLVHAKIEKDAIDWLAANPWRVVDRHVDGLQTNWMARFSMSDVITGLSKSVPMLADMKKKFELALDYSGNKLGDYHLRRTLCNIPGMDDKILEHDKHVVKNVRALIADLKSKYPMIWVAVSMLVIHNDYSSSKIPSVKETALDYINNLK